MFAYLIRRILAMVPTLFVISALVFAIIQAPPGDYLSTYIAELERVVRDASVAEKKSRARKPEEPLPELPMGWVPG